MAWRRGVRSLSADGYAVRSSEIPDRADLENSPRPQTVESFILTRAAERSWRKLNEYLEQGRGALWWVSGPPGCGKTHFLNYVIALQNRAGAMTVESSRRIACGFELAGRVRGPELEVYFLSVLAERIGAHGEANELWRAMRGAEAIEVALEQAARVGIHALTIAIDFALADCQSTDDYFASVARVAASSKRVRLNVIVAARQSGPRSAVALEVAPADYVECISTAIQRTRQLSDAADELVARAYGGLELLRFDPRAIYPFHPRTAAALPAIAGPPASFAAIARIAHAAERAIHEARGDPAQLIYPAELIECPPLHNHIESRLGDAGTAALRIAHDAARSFADNEAALAREIVDVLVVEHLAGAVAPPTISEIEARLAILAGRTGEVWTRPALEGLLKQLAAQTHGVIRFEHGARFDPTAAAEPEIALFNSALPLLRRFDPSLNSARDLPEMSAKLRRLEHALANAADTAVRVERVLSEAAREAGLTASPAHARSIADFIALAQSAPHALIEVGRDPFRREPALKTIAAYETIAAAAAILPRMRTIRDYLAATGLRAVSEIAPARDPAIAALETECELLAVEAGPRVFAATPRALDALEARFQKFKWTYVQQYRVGHENWRAELTRLVPMADDARRHLEALRRLNSISALGAPEGLDLDAALKIASTRVRRCEFDGRLAPETTPRCPSCEYILGAVSPREALVDILAGLRRALAVKLAALSQSVIAALIREHDTGHRLEGVLKIIQASQTDALVRVLDERLARYLAQLLDDNLGKTPSQISPPIARVDSGAARDDRRKAPTSSSTVASSARSAPRGRAK